MGICGGGVLELGWGVLGFMDYTSASGRFFSATARVMLRILLPPYTVEEFILVFDLLSSYRLVLGYQL